MYILCKERIAHTQWQIFKKSRQVTEAATWDVLQKKKFLKFYNVHKKTPVLESLLINFIKKRL